ncbi:MAG: ABC transporter permease [Armatimonadetes bacterium]|nr:ABC transporter permease [Armatimonadota bacterium]
MTVWLGEHQPGIREMKHSLRLIRRNHLTVAGLAIFAVLILVAIFAPLIERYDPYDVKMRERLRPPSLEHLAGTDAMGRDVFSRVIHGSRITLRVGFLVLLSTSLIGVPLGAISGYMGGRTDALIMRVGDIFLAFPRLVLALAMAAALGGGINNAIIAIAIPGWPWYARLIRGMTLSIREEQYIEAARAAGSPEWRVLLRHVLPNCIGPWMVQASMDMGWAIMSAAMLGFLGVGATPPEAEWGLMVAEGRNYLLDQWWMSVFPGVAIFITVLGYNLMGDGLRDIIDPRMRQR